MGGLCLLLAPAVLFTKYSELYNYLPSALMITLAVAALTCFPDEDRTLHLRRLGGAALILLGTSYAVCSAHRNWLLGRVAHETGMVLAGIRAAVPGPAAGAEFQLQNDPPIAQGYSLYGLRGVGTLEVFGVTPALQLLYGRSDVTGGFTEGKEGKRVSPAESATHAVYRLVWRDGEIRQGSQ